MIGICSAGVLHSKLLLKSKLCDPLSLCDGEWAYQEMIFANDIYYDSNYNYTILFTGNRYHSNIISSEFTQTDTHEELIPEISEDEIVRVEVESCNYTFLWWNFRWCKPRVDIYFNNESKCFQISMNEESEKTCENKFIINDKRAKKLITRFTRIKLADY